jgi:uncharacterized protein DUF29
MNREEFGGDYCAWVRDAARRLREGTVAGLDLKLVAEELESLAWMGVFD